jgi:hypothetical protein
MGFAGLTAGGIPGLICGISPIGLGMPGLIWGILGMGFGIAGATPVAGNGCIPIGGWPTVWNSGIGAFAEFLPIVVS